MNQHSFEYVSYGSQAIINMFTLRRLEILTSKAAPRAVKVND